ncbi:hypothetical protein [Nocardia sp. NPDC057668]|uniref:hypothetical protein n=1 Tax=Nocardia sp. NPDC057668 TaxID=3346202 RepID=UPI00366BEAFE
MGQSFVADLAGDEEFRLSRELARVRMVFELDLDDDEICRVRELFGAMAVRFGSRLGARPLIRKYPALCLITLVGHAGLAYDQGRYWESFFAELGMDRDQDFENALRAELGPLLKRFGLREFPELQGHYVQLMAMHAGIPVHCLGDLIQVIEHHLAVGRERSGAAVFEWLTEPGMAYRLNQLDVPVRNFLQLGGEMAVDIVDRILDFLEYVAAHPEVGSDLEVDSATTGLPTVLLNGLIDHIGEHSLGRKQLIRRNVPVIGYSTQDDQVVVRLPYPETASELPWRVAVNGEVREVYSERGWGIAEDGDHPLTPFPVVRPARDLVLRHDGSGVEHRIMLVDKGDPLLLFDLDGVLLPRRSALPRDSVLAMHPNDVDLVDVATGATVRSDEDFRTPTGWRGWRAHTVDLSVHNAIQLRGRAGNRLGVPREIRAVGAPRLELADGLEGVTSGSGLTVYAARPLIELPPCTDPDPHVWRVRVRRSGAADLLSDQEWESGPEQSMLDPFDGLDPGLLGLYDIVVTGPLGSDLRCGVFMAEGLSVEHSHTFRVPVPGGLSACETLLDCAMPLWSDRDLLTFGTESREARVEIGSGDTVHTLVITPPYFESRTDELGAPAQWRTAPQVLTPSDFETAALVAARVPGFVTADFAIMNAAGRIVQVETPDVPLENVFQISTRVFADTMRQLGSAELVARIDDPAGTSHTVVMARVQPTQLCGAIRVDERDLVFQDCVSAELGVFAWAGTAPWLAPWQLTITDGRAPLPDELCSAGDLLIQVFVDDPWLSVAPPPRPEDTAVRVPQPGWMRDENSPREGLSRFLAGVGPPPRSGGAMAEAWAALAALPSVRSSTAVEIVRGGLIGVLASDAREALDMLGGSMIPAAEMVSLLIRTGLAERPYASAVVTEHLHVNPWIGCLIEIAGLPYQASWRTDAPEKWEQLIGYLRSQGGAWLPELIEGRVGNARAGVFDATVEQLHQLPTAQLEELYLASQLVPGALLDEDTRTDATMAAFRVRREWAIDPASQILAAGTAAALRQIRRVAPLVYDLIDGRNAALDGVDVAAHPWMLLSVQSLTMAALARLDARGRFGSSPPIGRDMREAWARMAQLCPDLVVTDLLIAEALATAQTHPELIGAAR